MNSKKITHILHNNSFGYLFNKVLFDDRGRPFDFEILEANGACASFLGHEVTDLNNRRASDVFSNIGSDGFDWIHCFGAVVETGKTIDSVMYSRRLNRRFSFSVSSPSKGYVAVLFTTVVPEPSDSRYREIFRTACVPIIITDRYGNVSEINDAFTRMYGYTEREIAGAPMNFFDPGRDEYVNHGFSVSEHNEIRAAVQTIVENPEMRSWEGTVLTHRKDGSIVWVNLLLNGIYGADGSLEGTIGFPVDITQAHEKEARSRVRTYQTIAGLAELRDDDTGNHMKRVALLTKLIAKKAGMNKKFCDDIELFSPLHDIGKVGIRDSILRAARKLTAEEMDIMKTHTTLGFNIVKGKREFDMAADITLSHHECFDGSGYPNGLSGSLIPVSAQITAIADVYDALRSKRPYKEPWTHENTFEYIRNGAGTRFNPAFVKVFLDESLCVESVYSLLPDDSALYDVAAVGNLLA